MGCDNMTEFTKRETNAEELLRQVEGETREDAIKKWWALNGLTVDYDKRKAEYARQRQELTDVYHRVRYGNNRTPGG